MDTFLLQAIILLVAAPWWIPILHAVVVDLWTAAIAADESPDETGSSRSMRSILSRAQRRRTRRAVWSRDGTVWKKGRLMNPVWDTGRRVPPARKEQTRGKSGARIRPAGRARAKRWEGGFGRRGL